MLHRPLGITILGVLSQVTGVMAAFSGVAVVVLGMTVPFLNEKYVMQKELISGLPIEITGMIASLVGVVVIGFGVFSVIVGTGLLKAKKWAWTLEVISMFISLGLGVCYLLDDVSSGISSMATSALILYYLYRPNVRTYFGKNHLKSTMEFDNDVSSVVNTVSEVKTSSKSQYSIPLIMLGIATSCVSLLLLFNAPYQVGGVIPPIVGFVAGWIIIAVGLLINSRLNKLIP